MNIKTTLILIIAALLGLGAIYGAKAVKDSKQKQERALGTLLFPEYPVNDIEKVTIRDNSDSVTIEKKDGYWVVDDDSNFRAAYGRLSGLLSFIYQMKSGQPLKVRKESYQSIKVAHPDDVQTNSGCLVETFLKDGTKKSSFIVGRTKMRSREEMERMNGPMDYSSMFLGQYVRLTEEASPMLLSAIMPVDARKASWQDRFIINLDKNAIKAIAGPDYDLKGQDGDFTLEDGAKPNSGAITRLTGTLERLEATQARPREKAEAAFDRCLSVTLTNGLTYAISGHGEDGGEFLVKIDASYTAPDYGTNEVTQAQKQMELKAKDEVSLYNNWYGKYAYTVDKAGFQKLFVTQGDLSRPEKEESEAGEEEE